MRRSLVLAPLLWACATASPPLARVALRGGDPRTSLTVDGAPAGTLADYAQRRLLLRPGHHVLALRSADGAVAVREADVGPADDLALDLQGGATP